MNQNDIEQRIITVHSWMFILCRVSEHSPHRIFAFLEDMML
jgi:hypothetical protein